MQQLQLSMSAWKQALYKVKVAKLIQTSRSYLVSEITIYSKVVSNAGRWLRIARNRDSKVLYQGSPYESVTLITIGRDKRYFLDILTQDEIVVRDKLKTKKDQLKPKMCFVRNTIFYCKQIDLVLLKLDLLTRPLLMCEAWQVNNKAKNMALQNMRLGIKMYTAYGHEWRVFGHPQRKRTLHSVILAEGVSERIVADVKEFIGRSQWYIERGVPYRRGYLLYGPPGCGKTSFIFALASELEYSICMLSLGERSLTEDRFQYLLNMAPLKSIILLEDVDAAFISREEPENIQNAYAGLSRITFSGLLNALDGVVSSECRILVMTTNFVDRLDPALIRPGRVDLKQEISYCGKYQFIQLFQRFYHNIENVAEKAEQSANAIEHLNLCKISAAQIQGHLLMYKDDHEACIRNVNEITKQK